MRRIIIMMFFLMAFGGKVLLFSQIEGTSNKLSKSEVNSVLEEYVDFLKQNTDLSKAISKMTPANLNKVNIISDKEIKKICYEIYKAYSSDPVKITRLKYTDRQKAEKESKGNRNKYNEIFHMTIGAIETNLMNLVSRHLDGLQYNLLTTEIIVRAKVINKEIRQENDEGFIYTVNYLKILIEDIIKGNTTIQEGQVIEIAYNESWIDHNTTSWNVGQSYLFNLDYRVDMEESFIGVITGKDNNDGYFPIENDVLIDKTNYFQTGNRIKWESFREYLITYIKEIIL